MQHARNRRPNHWTVAHRRRIRRFHAFAPPYIGFVGVRLALRLSDQQHAVARLHRNPVDDGSRRDRSYGDECLVSFVADRIQRPTYSMRYPTPLWPATCDTLSDETKGINRTQPQRRGVRWARTTVCIQSCVSDCVASGTTPIWVTLLSTDLVDERRLQTQN